MSLLSAENKTLLICLGLGMIGWFAPVPEGLTLEGWRILVVFLTTILCVILKPLPMSATTLIGLGVLLISNTIELKLGFSGFAHPVIWLLILALFIAQCFVQTGLGQRIGYYFIRLFGKKALGLSYGLLMTDALISPAVPSVTARSAGIVMPIMQGIASSYDSHPHDPSSRRIGSFLITTVFQTTVITSAMFLTAMAANAVISDLTASQGLDISWTTWALAGIVPGIASLILMPLVVYFFYPPELKHTPEAPELAAKALRELGPMSIKEKILGATVLLLLGLWIFGDALHIKSVVAALVGLGVLLITRVPDWDKLLSKKDIWETFIWFSVLLSMAAALNQSGVMVWMTQHVVRLFGDTSWHIAFPLLALFYFYSHYLFASSTAHVTTMFVPFLSAAIALGAPPYLAAFILMFFSSLFGGITHYSIGPAPALQASGYVDVPQWCKMGFIVSVMNIIVWSTLGPLWWKLLGYW